MKLNFIVRDKKLVNVTNNGFIKNKYDKLTYYGDKSIELNENNMNRIEDFCKKNNGITIYKKDNIIEIYNDPFRTIPLYITKNNNDEIIIFSTFDTKIKNEFKSRKIDRAGFWEIILFESSIYTRTLFKDVKQMVAASKIVINIKRNDYKIVRYWDFDIREDKSVNSIEKAAKGLYERLDNIFSKYNSNNKYLMGISGGLDSRITLSFLSKYIPKSNVELFTYGHNKQILEYKYAKILSDELDMNKPEFHKIDKNSYLNAKKTLTRKSGGQIGINHSHIYDYLYKNKEKLKDRIQISNYYTDAIFGWATKKNKHNNTIEASNYYKKLKKQTHIDSNILNSIIDDLNNLLSIYKCEANYSTIDEFIYFVERNTKFHMLLAFIQSDINPSSLPYANFDLLKYMVSVPFEYREQKKIIDYILKNYKFNNKYINEIKNVSSSSKIEGGSKYTSNMEYFKFKLIIRINTLLLLLTGGKIQLLNKFSTEQQKAELHKNFQNELKESLKKLKENNLINKQQYNHYLNLPIRNKGISERFNFIGLEQFV